MSKGRSSREGVAGASRPVLALAKSTNRRLSSLPGQLPIGKEAAAANTAMEALPKVSLDVMSSNYEQWMKLATDNKITAANTWSFALIDYFHDLTLLRNGPNDESINFQKASSTLDGCVKVWTSRVDSVASETGKLLSGLASEGNNNADDEAEGEDGEDGENSEERKERRRNNRSSATLATSFTTLSVKKLDLEFSVDPLFKKTSADFDEGGAMGLLMNHLGVDGNCRVVFDAGDATLDDIDEEEELQEGEEAIPTKKHSMINPIHLKKEFLSNIDEVLERSISTQLSEFKFSSDNSIAIDLSMLINSNKALFGNNAATSYEEESENPMSFLNNPDGMDGDDFGGGDFFANDNDAYHGSFGADIMGGTGDGGFQSDDEGEGHSGEGVRSGMISYATIDGSTGHNVTAMQGGDVEGMFNYFDENYQKNWAGPGHWKLQRVIRKDVPPATEKKPSKSTKVAFKIDFESPEATINAKTLFAEPASKSTITMAGAKKAPTSLAKKPTRGQKKSSSQHTAEVKRDENALPNDMHFSSKQLVRLFLKPKFTVMKKERGGRHRQPGFISGNEDGEVDEQYWAEAAETANSGAIEDDMESQGGGPIPFDTQFFHDEGPEDDFSEIGEDGPMTPGREGLGDDDEMQPTGKSLWDGAGNLKRSRPEFVKYTKRAKRVDVKKLKDNIWSNLGIYAPALEGEEDSDLPEPIIASPSDDESADEPKVFSSVVEKLKSAYPTDKMEEISTSFCFICLLHLANERGLQLIPDRDPTARLKEAMPAMGEKFVGDLGFLKIVKDKSVLKGHA